MTDHGSLVHSVRRQAIQFARKLGFKKKNKREQVLDAVESEWDTNQSIEDLERIVWENVRDATPHALVVCVCV